MTCHRGGELRYGHYTSYVRAPNGQWYDADDDDMSPASLKHVLNDKNAYLLSYVRVEDDEYAAGPSENEPTQGMANGHVGNKPSLNGHASQPASPKKRKVDDDKKADKPFKRIQPTPGAPPTPPDSPPSSRFSYAPQKELSRPFSTKSGHHGHEGKMKKKHKGQGRHDIKRRGPPMPFAQGRHGKGMIGRMKRK